MCRFYWILCGVGFLVAAIIFCPDCSDRAKEILEQYSWGDLEFTFAFCIPWPRWNKPCSANPIVQKQIQKMRGGLLNWIRNIGSNDEGICCPNIGSSYVGASVISIRNTVPYKHPMGLPSSQLTNKPELIIEDSPVTVGKNWHFVGKGVVVIELFGPSEISGFSIAHPITCTIPDGLEKSAPREFSVVGMNDLDEKDPFHFGNYTYVIGGAKTQTFPVECCSNSTYQLIEFRFLSNHGNPDYTAVYKVKIHGQMQTTPETDMPKKKNDK